MKKCLIGVTALLLCVVSVGFGDSETNASETCSEVRVIYARGSGQTLQEDEYARFRDQLKERLSIEEESFYELGAEIHDNHKYEAVDIESPDNLAGAFFSAGMANDYGRSVDSGVDELKVYLNNLYNDCDTTKIVLAGYSQGAQVMGQSLSQLPPEIRKNIVFVALFGDPKLFLPEGVSGEVFDLPPACKDSRNASSWRRNIGNCLVSHGSLGPRLPYLPGDMEQKVGAWCVGGDWICGGLENVNLNSASAHPEEYPKQDGPIDQAAYEIAVRVDADGSITNIIPELNDLTGVAPRVMFMLDTATINNQTRFRTVEQPLMIAAANKLIVEMNGGAGIYTYGSKCLGFYSRATLTPSYFDVVDDWLGTCSPLEMTTAPHVSLDDAMKKSLSESFDGSEIPENAEKIFIILSDNPYSQPAQLASYRASQIQSTQDSFSIYVLAPEEVKASYESLTVDGVEVTILGQDDLDKILYQLEQRIFRQQVLPRFDSPDYKALPGQTITFSAEDSLVYNDEITEYHWQFYGGEYQEGAANYVSSTPLAPYAYPEPYSGEVTLTVLTESGQQKSTTAQVTVQGQEAFLPPIGAPDNLQVAATSPTTAQLSWDANELAEKWLVTLDGIPIGYTLDSSVTITDIEHWRDNVFSVHGVLADGRVGEKAEVVLGAYVVTGGTASDQSQDRLNEMTNNSAVSRSQSNSLLSSFLPNGNGNFPYNSGSNSLDAPRSPSLTAYGNPSASYSNVLLGILGASAVLVIGWVIVRKMVHKVK